MRVSVDIDDVVIDFTGGWQPIYENYFGIEVDGPVDHWDVCQFTHFNDKAEFFSWWERIDGWSQLGWVPGARGALDLLSTRPGGGLLFATARSSDLGVAAARRLGGRWAGGEGLYPQAAVHTHLGDKTTIKAGIHIDDAPYVAEQFVAAGKPMILFDQPWNQDVDDALKTPHSPIVRARNWADVLTLLGLS